jgi:hypothetical protein
MKRSLAAVLSMLHLAAATAAQGVCTRWSEPAKVGDLDVKIIMEASGIAVSRAAQRLYHNNDGSRPEFHITDLQGNILQTVRLKDFAAQDIEDISLGACGSNTCLYIADIGDNAVRRESVQIAVVREARTFSAEAMPEKLITARYPDGPHDAEAIAIHPSGDLFLATKVRIGQQAGPSQLFRLSAAQLAAGGEQNFEAAGTIPVAALSESLGQSPRRIVTAMDFSSDGRRLLLLTYDAAIEIALGEKPALPTEWTEGTTHRAFAIAPLLQSEAIAYDRDGVSILYSTESIRGTPAPLMKQICQD